MRFLRSSSIRKRFTSSMAIVITVIMVTFSVMHIFYKSRSMEKELHDQLTTLTIFSKESIASALWQYNYDYIRDYIESLFLYEDLVFASVNNNEMEISKKVHSNFEKLSFEDFCRSSEFITTETAVTYNQLNVGRVRLVLSRERVGNLVRLSSALAISMLLIVNLAVFGTNFFLSRKYLFKPLSQLESTVKKIAAGDLNASIDVSSSDEIGQLAGSFRQMMKNLKNITISRDDLNREVEDRKKIEMVLKDSLKEKEVLLKELHHRVKNNLQIIQSLLNLQSSKTENPELKQAISDSTKRLRSIALVHETLYRSENFTHLNLDTYFENIVKGLHRVYHDPEKDIVWTAEVAPMCLDLDKSIACGLIVNELMTNSFKYAFKNRNQGNIRLRLSQPSPDRAELIIADDGIGLPKDMDIKSCNSLGLQIVRILSEDQLNGKLDFYNHNGLTVRLNFRV